MEGSSTPVSEQSTVAAVVAVMERVAPLRLAADWDNVGLLVGRRQATCARVMTCLTVTEGVIDEAIDRSVNLIVTHHPIPFHSLKSITDGSVLTGYLLRLIQHGIAIYSAHTAFDSASRGINQQLAEGLCLDGIRPMLPDREDPSIGAGRLGSLMEGVSTEVLASALSKFTGARSVRIVGRVQHVVRQVGIACGSGGSFLQMACAAGCDCLVTGEATFHTCLEAEAQGVSLILSGHYASERFAMEWLAGWLGEQLVGVEVWASHRECDPLRTLITP